MLAGSGAAPCVYRCGSRKRAPQWGVDVVGVTISMSGVQQLAEVVAMKRAFLALGLLLGAMASTATAEYIVIVANLSRHGSPQPQTPVVITPPRPTPPPGALGPAGGAPTGPSVGANSPFGPSGPASAVSGGPVAPPLVEPFDPDKVPLMIVAVVESDEKISNLLIPYGQLGWVKFKLAGQPGKVWIGNTSVTQASVLRTLDAKGKPTPTASLHDVYEGKAKALKESKTPVTADQWIELAEWCLAKGMLAHFKDHMEAAVAVDKANPKAAAYLQTKAALAKPVASVDAAGNPVDIAGRWKEQLLSTRYQARKAGHYIILQDDKLATDLRAPRLEETFQTFFYWFAMHGVQLPVPTEPQIVILTKDAKEFKHLNSVLDSSPVISDSFHAHRENLVVLSSKRLDEAYDRLEKLAAPLWGQGYNRDVLLKGQLPKGQISTKLGPTNPETKEAMTMSLLLKLMETDAEVAGTQNGAIRQLLYSSGLLPATVNAPEWIQFGASTFFETSPGSPWPTVGMPNFTYHPLFKGLMGSRKLPPDQLDLLREVVTDGFFRAPADGLTKEAAVRRARASAWSLSYFLLRKRMDGMLQYFKELSQLPRDLTLDEQTLWLTFAKAFGAVTPTGEPDEAALRQLADDWDKDLKLEQYDNREMGLMALIRLAFEQAARQNTAPPPEQAGAPPPVLGAPRGNFLGRPTR
jgi:hypothetical protein